MSARAIFLDRDGVINAYVYHPEFGTVDSPARAVEFALLPGVTEAIRRFNRLGLLVVIASNQPGIAKRKFTVSQLQAMTHKMLALVRAAGGTIDGIYYCRHHPDAILSLYRKICDCRKPKPGLLLSAARELNIDVRQSYVVGDGVTDIMAGRAAGCTTLFISGRKCYICGELARRNVEPDFIVRDLAEAAEVIQRIESRNLRSAQEFSFQRCMSAGGTAVNYIDGYVQEAISILRQLDRQAIQRTIELIAQLRQRGGRLFFMGVGGGAGNASHAVNDFRKIAGIEAYTPTDNVSELTARVNDEGWDTAYVNWLRGSRLNPEDMVFVFSVGGGDPEHNISNSLVKALHYAKEVGATICGVVGRDGGFTVKVADACVLVPVVNPETITPHTEAFQAIVWHLIVSHPALKVAEMKWESVGTPTVVSSS